MTCSWLRPSRPSTHVSTISSVASLPLGAPLTMSTPDLLLVGVLRRPLLASPEDNFVAARPAPPRPPASALAWRGIAAPRAGYFGIHTSASAPP